ncbi:DUF3592 domain-containing protein [Singulisphaera sp. Ch08]|uniref:DUF3592 domain-containing protein n=1 Tax=Singulisphaera sp. Ch08 TaxID=3120278 RepID=A0AAU7C7P8_9BACT
MNRLGRPHHLLMAFFATIGFVVLGMAAWSTYLSMLPKGWPTARGTMIELAMKRHQPGTERGNFYRVTARYTYAVEGKRYEGTRIAFGYMMSGDRDEHAGIYRRLKASREVSVRYDPSNPTRSCLIYGVHGSIRDLYAFSAVWLTAVSGFAWLFQVAARRGAIVRPGRRISKREG